MIIRLTSTKKADPNHSYSYFINTINEEELCTPCDKKSISNDMMILGLDKTVNKLIGVIDTSRDCIFSDFWKNSNDNYDLNSIDNHIFALFYHYLKNEKNSKSDYPLLCEWSKNNSTSAKVKIFLNKAYSNEVIKGLNNLAMEMKVSKVIHYNTY